MLTSRRRLLFGAAASLVAAPAIVRVASLMPVSVMKPTLRTFTVTSVLPSSFDVVYGILPIPPGLLLSGTNWRYMTRQEAVEKYGPPDLHMPGVGDTFTISGLYEA